MLTSICNTNSKLFANKALIYINKTHIENNVGFLFLKKIYIKKLAYFHMRVFIFKLLIN